MAVRYCKNCGEKIEEGFAFCIHCGAKVVDDDPKPKHQEVKVSPEIKKSEIPAEDAEVKSEDQGEKLLFVVQVLKSLSGMKQVFKFESSELFIGRNEGDVIFPDDYYLSTPHARIFVENGEVYIEDLSELNGVFIKIDKPYKLKHGDVFLCGEQVFKFGYVNPLKVVKDEDNTYFSGTPIPNWKVKIVQIIKNGLEGNVYPTSDRIISIGREDCDLNFPEDKFMSVKHCLIEEKRGDYFLIDKGSRNGTYVKIQKKVKLPQKSIFYVGKELLKLEYSR